MLFEVAFKDADLWASENRSREQRKRTKVLSKIKKFLIELQNVDAKHVMVNYDKYEVKVRASGKLCLVATVTEDALPEWVDDAVRAEEGVREALKDFIDDLEL